MYEPVEIVESRAELSGQESVLFVFLSIADLKQVILIAAKNNKFCYMCALSKSAHKATAQSAIEKN